MLHNHQRVPFSRWQFPKSFEKVLNQIANSPEAKATNYSSRKYLLPGGDTFTLSYSKPFVDSTTDQSTLEGIGPNSPEPEEQFFISYGQYDTERGPLPLIRMWLDRATLIPDTIAVKKSIVIRDHGKNIPADKMTENIVSGFLKKLTIVGPKGLKPD